MRDFEAERRRSRMTIAFAVAALVVLIAAVTPSPYVVESPGPVVDTLGDVEVDGEDEPLITISGAETFPTSGSLSLTSVTLTGSPEHPTKWLSLVVPFFDPDQRIAPRSEFFPEGLTEDQRNDANTALMGSSQVQAAAAAAQELGDEVPVRLVIADVVEDGPADGRLESGDEVRTVNGEPIASVEGLRSAVAATPDGDAVEVGITRDGEESTEAVTPETPEGSDAPLIGVTIGIDYDLPFELEMGLEDIGGPSAGMIFALAIYDKLTPEDLMEDREIAGTGTIDGEGNVGGIGGLPQKIAGAASSGAELFVMPMENCADLPSSLPDGMAVVPVGTLGEALSAIEAFDVGDEVPGTEACGTATEAAR